MRMVHACLPMEGSRERELAQEPPSLEQGLTARPFQPLPHCRFRKEKLNLWVPVEAVFSSSPASTNFPPIWAQAASTLARSGGAPDASITQKVCPLLLLRAYVFTCHSHMHISRCCEGSSHALLVLQTLVKAMRQPATFLLQTC